MWRTSAESASEGADAVVADADALGLPAIPAESSSLTRRRVVDVSGSLGIIKGFRLIVPMGKSESKAWPSNAPSGRMLALDRSDRQPLDEVVDAELLLARLLTLSVRQTGCNQIQIVNGCNCADEGGNNHRKRRGARSPSPAC